MPFLSDCTRQPPKRPFILIRALSDCHSPNIFIVLFFTEDVKSEMFFFSYIRPAYCAKAGNVLYCKRNCIVSPSGRKTGNLHRNHSASQKKIRRHTALFYGGESPKRQPVCPSVGFPPADGNRCAADFSGYAAFLPRLPWGIITRRKIEYEHQT